MRTTDKVTTPGKSLIVHADFDKVTGIVQNSSTIVQKKIKEDKGNI